MNILGLISQLIGIKTLRLTESNHNKSTNEKWEIILCDPGVHTNSPGVEKTRPCRVEQDGPRSNSK